MARVHHRKARKDYPANGIAKGDMYYYAKIKTGPYSSRVIRQKDPIRQSQMTSSPFKQAWFAMEEGLPDVFGDAETIRETGSTIREIGEEVEESYNNMPEGLQEGDTGQMLNERFEGCYSIADELDGLADELESLEEPGEFDPSDYAEETSNMDPEDVGEFLDDMQQEHNDERDVYEQEVYRICSDARELVEMP